MEDEQGTGVEDEELDVGQTHYEKQTDPATSSSTRPGKAKLTTKDGQTETPSLYRSTSTAGGKLRLGNLRARGRKKYLVALLTATVVVGTGGLIIHTLAGSLELLNLHHHISERRLTRYVRTFNKNAANLTAEKVTVEAAGTKSAAAEKGTPLGEEIKSWNPEQTLKNQGSTVAYKVEYEGGRPVRVVFDGDPVPATAPEFKNFFTIDHSSPEWQRFYKEIYSKTDAALLRDTNSYAVRSRISKQIINEFHGNLFWWSRKGLEEKGKTDPQIVQDEQKRILERDRQRSSGAVTARDTGLKSTEDEALAKEKACLDNPACAKEVSSAAKTLPEAAGSDKVVADFAKRVQHPPGLSGIFAVLNPIFVAAVPICIIHDGSMTAVADFLRAQQAAGMAAFLGLASQVSQQTRGDVTGEAVGGAIQVLGNISQTIPEKWARGEPTSTLSEPFAQAARYQNYTILKKIFGRLIFIVKLIVQYICPILLNPFFLGATFLLSLIQIFRGVAAEAGAAASIARIEVRSVVSRTVSRVIANLSLNSAQRKLIMNGAMKFALGLGGQYAATTALEKAVRMAVMGEMGSFYAGSDINDGTNTNTRTDKLGTSTTGIGSYFASLPHYFAVGLNDGSNKNPLISEQPAPYVNQMDMGAVAYNNELDRQQNFGRPMTPSETQATQEIDKDWVVIQKNSRSFFQKHIALSQPDSTLSRAILGTNQAIENPSTVPRFFARLPRYVGSMFSHMFGQAQAAQTEKSNTAGNAPDIDTSNYNIIQWGWTREEIDKIDRDPTFEPLRNAKLVAPMAALIAKKYGPCYAKDSGSLQEVELTADNAKYLSHDDETGQVDNRGICNPHSLGMNNSEFGPMMVLRWRYDCSLQSSMVEMRDIQRADGTATTPRNCGVEATNAAATTSNSAVTQMPAPMAPASLNVTGDENTPCDTRTKDLGVYTGYQNGSPVQIRLCSIPNMPCSNEECNGGYGIKGADGHALVNSTVSKNWYELVEAAKQDGVSLSAFSTFRTFAHQQALCPCDGINVGRPGYSNHQMGLAIDISGLPKKGPVPGNPIWDWLSANANKFGLYNYPHEAWHWSTTGH